MNLKMVEPNFKSDLVKIILDNDFLGNHIRKIREKKLLKEDLCSAQRGKFLSKNDLEIFPTIDHKYQVQTIIKRLQNTIRKDISKKTKRMIQSRNKVSTTRGRSISQFNDHNSIINSDMIGLVKANSVKRIFKPIIPHQSRDMTRNLSLSSNNSILCPQPSLQLIKFNSSNLFSRNRLSNSVIPSKNVNSLRIPQKIFYEPLINYDRKDSPSINQEIILKSLREKCQFYQKEGECKFNRLSYHIFTKRNLNMKFYPKPSFQRINSIIRKNNNHSLLKVTLSQ